jgi:hypothetical protein
MKAAKAPRFIPMTCPDAIGITKKGWEKIASPLDGLDT